MKEKYPSLMGLGDWGKYDLNGNLEANPNFPASQLFKPSQYAADKCKTGYTDGTTDKNPFACFAELGDSGHQEDGLNNTYSYMYGLSFLLLEIFII